MEIKRALESIIQSSVRVAVLVEKSKKSKLSDSQIKKKIERVINAAPPYVEKSVETTDNIDSLMEIRIKRGEFDKILKVNQFGHIITHPDY